MSRLPDETRQRVADVASHVMIVGSLLLIMWQGLLPGLLCVCLGFLSTRWLSPNLAVLTRSPNGQAPRFAAAVVALLPVLLLAVALPRT